MVVPWADVLAYFHDMRERVILNLADAESDKDVWRGLGKLDLLDELANLQAILATLSTFDKPS